MTPEEAAKTAAQIRLVLAQDSCLKDSFLKDGNRAQDSSVGIFSIREPIRSIRSYVQSVRVKFQRNFMKFIQFHGFKSTSTKEENL